MLNLDDFYRARYVLSNVVRRTDLIYAPKINQESEIYLKPENLQVTGSFKLRELVIRYRSWAMRRRPRA